IAAFEEQMAVERQALAGSDSSLAPLIAEYERLSLEREFAERAFASSRTALDFARIDAERQKLFIEQISVPSRPDYPKYPYRLLSTLGVFILLSFMYAVARRLVADARGHAGH
ncbi:MAG: capsule biosynthesis protein, partial [Hyphomicrobium sp.]